MLESICMESWKTILLVFGGSVLLVVLMAIGLSKVSGGSAGTIKVSVDELVNGARWIVMSGEPKVTVVEFSDIQCPACKAVEPVAVELRKTAGVKFVYRHFPLITVHKNAWKGARALEAARMVDKSADSAGKGWEMMKVMFDKQEEWSDKGDPGDLFVEYAKGLGLDEKAFVDKMGSEETDRLVGEDSSFGNRLRLSGTPTFFVNGEQVGSAYVLEKVKSLLK